VSLRDTYDTRREYDDDFDPRLGTMPVIGDRELRPGVDHGRRVVYAPKDGFTREEGVITSWVHNLVFVRYGSDTTSKATYPRDLEWAPDAEVR